MINISVRMPKESGRKGDSESTNTYTRASIVPIGKNRGARVFLMRSAEQIDKVFDKWQQTVFSQVQTSVSVLDNH